MEGVEGLYSTRPTVESIEKNLFIIAKLAARPQTKYSDVKYDQWRIERG